MNRSAGLIYSTCYSHTWKHLSLIRRIPIRVAFEQDEAVYWQLCVDCLLVAPPVLGHKDRDGKMMVKWGHTFTLKNALELWHFMSSFYQTGMAFCSPLLSGRAIVLPTWYLKTIMARLVISSRDPTCWFIFNAGFVCKHNTPVFFSDAAITRGSNNYL